MPEVKDKKILIFAKNSAGDILVRGGILLPKKLIPLREINFASQKIHFDEEVYISEIEVFGNRNGLQPGMYRIAYAKNLHGVDDCEYTKVDFKKFPLLKDSNIHFSTLFGVW